MTDEMASTKAAALAKRLRHAMVTMQNDDLSAPGTDKRARHILRTEVLLDAADFLEALARPSAVQIPALVPGGVEP